MTQIKKFGNLSPYFQRLLGVFTGQELAALSLLKLGANNLIQRLIAFCGTTAFLVGLCLFLLTTTLGAITWGVQTAAMLTAANTVAVNRAVETTLAQARVRQVKAVMKTKAKARIRRAVVAIPVIGLGAMVYFEERNFKEWLEDNPDGTRQEYGCEVVDMTAEVLEEVLQELPAYVRPEPETVFKLIPKCEPEKEARIQSSTAINHEQT